MSRYHLCIEALRRTSRLGAGAPTLAVECRAAIEQAAEYARAHFEDPPEIRDWEWDA
jgi:xylulose-5-phosphate/fructose-6-phosphate phosphoketolase